MRRVSNHSRIAMILAAVLLLLPPIQHAESRWPNAQTSAATRAAAISDARKVAQEILARGIPGMAVAVAVNGEIVWSEGFGFADLEEKVPAGPTTRFRIGSISKPLTAVAAMRLVEDGKLDLDAPVQKYVPSFPDKGAPITTRLLGGHLAGIRHYKGDEFTGTQACSNVLEGLKIFQDDPLVAPPGTKYSYSTNGFNLISAVVESAAKQNFLSYVEEQVFRPAGMRDTTADRNGAIIERRSRFYSRRQPNDPASLMNGPFVDNSCKWAGGGFISTVEDLVRFGSVMIRGGIVKPESRTILFTPQKTSDGKETTYGFGWSVGKDAAGRRHFSHGGGSIGGTSQLILYPDAHVVVAVLTNLTSAPYGSGDAQKIAAPFLK